MAVFLRNWNPAYEALPPDTENAKNGAERINEVKVDVRERLIIDHSWAGDVDDGLHKQVSFVDPLASKPTVVANQGFLYTKDVAGTVECFFEDELGNEIQLTSDGMLGLAGQAIVGNLTGDVTGSATTWAIARNIVVSGDVSGTTSSFDGSADATLNLQLGANSVGASEIAANAVGASEITANAIGASELDTTGATYGSFVLSFSTKVIPAGLLTISIPSPTDTHAISIYDGSSWRTSNTTFIGGTIYSDGVNVRMVNSGGNDTAHYRRLA